MPPKRDAVKRKGVTGSVGPSKKVHVQAKTARGKSTKTPSTSLSPAKKSPNQESCDHGKTKIVSPKSTKGSANFSWFMKVYKGLSDWHIPIFRETVAYTCAKHVLYPGCDKHITASLLFPSVVYVDFNAKMGPVFKDKMVLDWVRENKDYDGEATVKFLCKNFDSTFEKVGSFDLMISACAGIVSTKCAKYLRKGGYFLVSDAHFDARMAFLDNAFELVGVFDTGSGKLNTDKTEMSNHFTTTKGTVITREQVEESIEKSKSKRSFKLKKEAMFYLFKKIK